MAGPEGYTIDVNALLVVDTGNPSIIARVPLGGGSLLPPVVDASGARVYVARHRSSPPPGGSNDVAVVDTASRTIVSTIPVQFSRDGAFSKGMLLRPQGDRLYVTTQESFPFPVRRGALSVIDTATNAIIEVVPLDSIVGPMAVERSGARLYVVQDESSFPDPMRLSLAILEGRSGAVLTTIPLAELDGMPFAVAVRPDGSAVYVADGRHVLVVDTVSGLLHAITLPSPPPPKFRELTALVVDPAGEFVLALGREGENTDANGTGGFMVVIDAHTALASGEVALPLIPDAGAVHPGGRVFVTGHRLGFCRRLSNCPRIYRESAGVAVVDVATGQVLELVDTGPAADAGVASPLFGAQVQPDRASVYVVEPNARVSVIDAATAGLVAQFPGGGIAIGTEPSPVPGSQQLYVVSSSSLPPAAFPLGAPGDHPVPRDYDGDGWVDLAVWRPREGGEEGLWFIRRSSDEAVVRQQWGAAAFGDVPVPADYDGDGHVDVAVWRPAEGIWYVVRSSDGSAVSHLWGGPGDVPVSADYDGDGRADLAIWRPGFGDEPPTWFVLHADGTALSIALGMPTDVPVPADYDGDGRADAAIWRPSTGEWLVLPSNLGVLNTARFGQAGDVPVPADYDGDGRADPAVWRPSTGEWFILRSSDGALVTRQWGASGDRPMPADYDGDGRADLAVYRP